MRQQLFVVAYVMMVVACAPESLLWQRYTENDFPARVRSVTTALGNVLDESRVLKYGAWTVSFGKGIPYAFYRCAPNSGCEISIKNLKCESSQVRVGCVLKLQNRNHPTCELIIPEREALQILCPHDMVLEKDVIPSRGRR
jgi:hypothetical protein